MYEPVHESFFDVQSPKSSSNSYVGWRVDNNSPITASTAYRWITDAVLSRALYHAWEEAETYTLFPVEVRPNNVLTYSVHKNGAALSRESQDIIVPGDYGLYAIGKNTISFHPFSSMEEVVEENSPLLSAKASLTAPIIQQALDRDRQCIFSGVVPSCGSDALVATWLSDDPWLENKYYQNPDACDLSDLMVVDNVVSGRKDIVTLFWENKLGVDVEDDYRIILFEGSESLKSGVPLKSHMILVDGPYRPSDRFLRLHFQECLAVSVGRGDVLEDYRDQEIEIFMEELGIYDDEIDTGDPRWSTPLGSHVHAYLIRQKMAEQSVILYISL
ncbi:hypothetical protein BU17DRAFT_79301 [Hysterangium stoloniferum]|nr:hypothetical protein BU17DRAFT_79301 [Hysterangium stoloniferum]